jgi:hypothetical protein
MRADRSSLRLELLLEQEHYRRVPPVLRTASRVVKPIVVDGGTSAPWFGQPGLGTQYELPGSVSNLLKSGYLERVSQ